MAKTMTLLTSLWLVALMGCSPAVLARELTCGIATGFPPYQYNQDGRIKGFDADVINLVMARLGWRCRFVQAPWDHVVNGLRYGKLDLVVGMEIEALRERYFAFTRAYIARKSVIFVSTERSEVTRKEQLYGQFVAGDRSSLIEQMFIEQGIRSRFRMRELESKADSMQLLKTGEVQAAIMPLEVGLYLAREQQVPVRILAEPQSQTPVAIAVLKGNDLLRDQLDKTLQQLLQEGAIAQLYQDDFASLILHSH